EELYGREVVLADRELVEQQSDTILADAKDDDIAFLVVGDPFGATTHTDLVIRARQLNIPYRTLHNASILNAIGCCGLQNTPQCIDIECYWMLWIADIKVKEQTIENMMRGRKIYEPPRYLSVSDAVKQLLEIPKLRNLTIEEAGMCIQASRVPDI
ncbi:hypothetical protein QZH41_011032, partial [Actinostola sp. cb2023]